MAETFEDRLEEQTLLGSLEAAAPAITTFGLNRLQVRHLNLMTGVRATTDRSDWIFVGNAVQIWVAVTRASNSAGEAADVVVALNGYFGVDKPASTENGVTIQSTAGGENQEQSLELHSGSGPVPMWFRAVITTAVTDADDYVDVNAKIITG